MTLFQRQLVFGALWGLVVAGAVGASNSVAYGVLSAPLGIMFGVALARGVVPEMLAGMLKFAFAAAMIGPGCDWLINGYPFTRSLDKALVAGAMIGAFMGIKNAKYSRRLLAKRKAAENQKLETGARQDHGQRS